MNSNQIFRDQFNLYSFLITESNQVCMQNVINPAGGFDYSYWLSNDIYNTGGVWFQVGGNITKNGIKCSNGVNTAWSNFSSSERAPVFDSNTGEWTVRFSMRYRVDATLMVKRISGTGERIHHIGLSINGADPSLLCASSVIQIGGQDLCTLHVDRIIHLNAGDKICLNYCMTNVGGNNLVNLSLNMNIVEIK